MSEMSDEYKKIMEEIENKISNEEEKKFVKEKLAELSFTFIDIIDRLTKATDMKIKEIEEQQEFIEKRMATVQTIVDGIESDIYEDDEEEDYEFEVACPYCNYEFSVDIDSVQRDEIECPECHNVIELDWNEEETYCSGGCSHCLENCVAEEEEEEYNVEEQQENKNNQEENEDDM
jgi:hypothetical protein